MICDSRNGSTYSGQGRRLRQDRSILWVAEAHQLLQSRELLEGHLVLRQQPARVRQWRYALLQHSRSTVSPMLWLPVYILTVRCKTGSGGNTAHNKGGVAHLGEKVAEIGAPPLGTPSDVVADQAADVGQLHVHVTHLKARRQRLLHSCVKRGACQQRAGATLQPPCTPSDGADAELRSPCLKVVSLLASVNSRSNCASLPS
jgi:hypothetical protein